MQNRILLVNPLLNEVIVLLTKICGKCSFDVLYLDLSSPEHSIDKIIKGDYELLVFQYLSSANMDPTLLIDFINYGYLSGKKILLVSDTQMFIDRVEKNLNSTIKELKNIKYALCPIDESNFIKRFNQLYTVQDLKTTQDIFDELQTEIVKRRNIKRSNLVRLVERFI